MTSEPHTAKGSADHIPYATPLAGDPRRAKWLRWTLMALVAGWVAWWVAILSLVMIDNESVIITGPLIIVVGIVTVSYANRVGMTLAQWVGLGHVACVILGTTLVLFNNWRPRQAQGPLFILGMIYLLASLLPTAIACLRVRSQLGADDWTTNLKWIREGGPVAVLGMVAGLLIMVTALLANAINLAGSLMHGLLIAGSVISAGGLVAYAVAARPGGR